jgi:hypothetical protein
MKTKNLFLTVVFLFIATLNYAQTSAEASGIAIQGIARDANNTARIDADITLRVELYYINASNQPVTIAGPEDKNLTTDNFGLFSFVLEPGAANNAKIANQQAYLKISEGSTTISDEKLNHVPYAIAANNGVPTGSIMPWVGDENAVPTGWVLCNNQSLTGVVGSENLIALVGNNAPDLRGMFLRGAGTNAQPGYTTYSGTGVNTMESDSFINHTHEAGGLTTESDGGHNHRSKHVKASDQTPDNRFGDEFNDGSGDSVVEDTDHTFVTSYDGLHTHVIEGSTGESLTDTADQETRPVHYGVNYIIKL